MKPVPTKVERKYLKDFAQLEERFSLAQATHEVSVFTSGILAMETTLMGIIKLDPKQLLEVLSLTCHAVCSCRHLICAVVCCAVLCCAVLCCAVAVLC